MSGKDLHKKPFDDGTLAKLEIFEDYAEAWIPTFVMSNVPRLAIFDFFAGQGYDESGVPGSAIRILRQIKAHIENIHSKRVSIHIYLNEFVKRKFALLKASCDEYLILNPDVAKSVTIHYSNEDFEILFPQLSPKIGLVPSLVYLDQNGIKAISQRYFQELESKRQTDFLYFVSSSYFWRFGESEEFKSHIDIDIAEAKLDSYRFIHRYVLNQIKKGLPAATKLMLYPFSIKKGANIHGLIFGATHPFAVDKFLRIAWKRNENNGEANFDIDDDDLKAQPDLWGNKKPTKLESFETNILERIINGDIANNVEALEFAYAAGHLGSHADKVLRSMKKDGHISYDGLSPLVTYEAVYKQKKIVRFERLKK
ncbi:MAG: three-Cys-motif partner protein TcmP [Pyrinomonadaceae bacterium]